MFDHFRADIHRYKRRGPLGTLRLLLETQGLWACACYRAGRHLGDHRPPPVLRQVIMAFYHLWWKGVEVTTGISIPPDCRIGPGLYIGHFGQIILHSQVEMGENCNISQGVTIGLARRKGEWGVPTVGDRVYIAPGAKVIGPIHLADGTVVGANSVVIQSTEADQIVAGVPARVVGDEGSAAFVRLP